MTTQNIWIKYNKDVRQFILSKVKDEQVADDLLQEVFLKVHSKLETLKDQNKLKPWVFSISRNTIFDYFRAHKISQEFIEDKLGGEEDVATHDEKDCLRGILKSIPKKYRDPLFLSDIKGMKQAEVAKQLSLQLPTAKSRIQRARKLIAKGYMDCCDFKMNDKGVLVGEIKDKEDCKVCS